jgi:hypothetical protein
VKIWLDDQRVEIAPTALLGQGGEAEVYDLGDGRVAKLFKPPAHPDLAGLDEAQRVAAARLVEHQAKLPAFPAGLPGRVVAPIALARRTRRGELIGYAMRKVAGDALYHVGEPGWRRASTIDPARVTAALLDLGATVEHVHAAGVVIGDFNDLNVMIDGDRCWLIDADSFQWGPWRCSLFSERFVDPRLCDPTAAAPVLVRPHDRDSDWFAFAAMALRSLLCVGPYGGVHQPADPARRVPPAQRARRGVSIYDPDVRTPRASLPTAILPDELNGAFHAVFAGGARGRFPLTRLADLRWRRCACGAEHARTTCPVCRTAVAVPAVVVRGGLRATRVDPRELRASSWMVGARPQPGAPSVWLDGGMLYRDGGLGPEVIGQVLAGHTRAWVGPRLGVGFYRAGAWMVGFVFRPDRRGVDDQVALPRLRGLLIDAHAVVADDRAWLFWREAFAGKETITCTVIAATGAIIASHSAPAAEAPWGLAAGAVAAGPHLFVPTDGGVIRLEASAATREVSVTRTFPDTADLVDARDQLALGPRGLDVRKPDGALRLEL